MDELKERLIKVSDSYFDFVGGILQYAKRKLEHVALLNKYMDENPDATSSDIVYFVTIQPDFFEDSAVHAKPDSKVV